MAGACQRFWQCIARASGDLDGRAISSALLKGVLMKISEEGQLLRIFIGESDKWEGKPLYEALIFKAREMGLAGATMLRGLMGYGAASRVHTAKILRLSEDLPVIVEIVDSQERIASFLPIIDEMVQEGLVTLERAQIILYRHNRDTAGASS
jgi:PII-like signaling protein